MAGSAAAGGAAADAAVSAAASPSGDSSGVAATQQHAPQQPEQQQAPHAPHAPHAPQAPQAQQQQQQQAAQPASPAEAAPDDALLCVFKALAEGFCAPDALAPAHLKAAVGRFIWFRTTLPAVCSRWRRLALGTPALWAAAAIDPLAEAHSARRSFRHHGEGGSGSSGVLHGAGSSPPRAAPPGSGGGGHGGLHAAALGRSSGGGGLMAGAAVGGYFASDAGGTSGMSTPNRGASPVLGSSPESESGGYWSSHFAPQHHHQLLGGSPPARLMQQRLSRISGSRHLHRATLSAAAVNAWLAAHPAAAGGISRLHLDLSQHPSAHDYDLRSLECLLQRLPRLQRVQLVGAVEGTDAYEPLARVRQLQELELLSASQACLDGGLLGLCFLPQLTSLAVSLDIPPASPLALSDLPTGLASLRLGAMWLEALPPQLAECHGLTSITLERCQLEQNPLPLLLTLPRLAAVTIRSSSSGSGEAGQPLLLPMRRPQQQAAQAGGAQDARRSGGRVAAGLRRLGGGLRELSSGGSNAGSSGSGSSSKAFLNTSITSLAFIDVGLSQLPACVSQLVALADLQLPHNHELGQHPSLCLPQELTCLTGLQSLCLGYCGLGQLPPVVAALSCLTRLELQGNALSAVGFGGLSSSNIAAAAAQQLRDPQQLQLPHVACSASLRVLDLTHQGAGRLRMRGIPAWVGACSSLTELHLGCYCLGHGGPGAGSAAAGGPAPARAWHELNPGGGSPVHSNAGSLHGGRGGSPAPSLSGTMRCLALGSHSAAAAALPEGLSVQQLPRLLPQLELLVLEGATWEQRAVRDALALVRTLERSGSRLRLELPL